MYESPIKMNSSMDFVKIRDELDGVLIETVCKAGFTVDKEELERALLYDRNQYKKGYQEGYQEGYQNAKRDLGLKQEAK